MEDYKVNSKILRACISGIDSLASEAELNLKSVAKVKYVHLSTEQELVDCLKECDIFWFRLNHQLTRKILEHSNVSFIVCAVTGLDHIDIEACKEFNIKIISLKNEFSFLNEVRATAEHTLALMLLLSRKLKRVFTHVEEGNWDRTLFKGTELYKKKIGILGMGRLGKIVAEYCAVFGASVYFYDTNRSLSEVPKSYICCDSIESLCSEVDILSIHIPYNLKNHFLINRAILDKCKPEILILNTSRGGIVDEQAIALNIENKKIGGYATDVLFGEPIIKNHVLVKLAKTHENVIITPHIGGNTFESVEKTENFVAQKLLKLIKN
ncbi:NAD(P)-dependent oxidoreductase [Lutibacter sp.]|uniref:NAD(P)-dependent oxidoreductase n=1 Tax=Lutibacter sp. TaxID=1925666 RepID=UPI00356A4400